MEIRLLDIGDSTVSQDGDYQPDLEAFEGMLVTFPEALTLVETFQCTCAMYAFRVLNVESYLISTATHRSLTEFIRLSRLAYSGSLQ